MHTTTHKIAAIGLVVLGLWAGMARAQIPVTDIGNAALNTITSIMSTATTIQSVLQTAYMVLEITGIADLATGDDFTSDLATLSALAGEGIDIAADLQSINAQITSLFSPDSAPVSALGLRKHQTRMRQAIFDAHSKAAQAQTLIRTVAHTVEHIKRLLDRIAGFSGNMEANQNINEALASLQKIQSTQAATTMAFQRAMTLQAMEGPVIQQSLQEINRQFCGKWCQ